MARSRPKKQALNRRTAGRKRKRSPAWLAVTGLAAILLGVFLVMMSYVVTLPGGALNLVWGFALMGAGLVLLSKYR